MTRERVEEFMAALGRSDVGSGRVYFTGGVTALLFGWREVTVDIDLKAEPEPRGFFQVLGGIGDRLEINIELASAGDFLPPLPGWEDRSLFIAQYGKLAFYHYDLYSQALAKIQRSHDRDRHDVAQMLAQRLIQPARLRELFAAIHSELPRYPRVRPAVFAERLEQTLADFDARSN